MSILQQAKRELERTEAAARKFDKEEKTENVAVVATGAAPEPIDEAALHGIAGDAVRTVEPHSESDRVALLGQILAFAGAIVGRTAFYLVESTKHHANLFLVTVGQSSKSRKGTSYDRVRDLFKMAGEILGDAFDGYCVDSGLSSGEGLIHAVRDATDDDVGVTDKRRLIAESEYAGLLRVMTRDGNIISRIVRDAWDRGDLGTMTKKCPTRATGAHIAIIGHITKDELVAYLDRTECANGFANRFLFACVKRSKFLPHGGSLTDAELGPIAKQIAAALDHAKHLGRITMDEAASALWCEVYKNLSEGQPGLYGSVTGRAEAQVIRLALIYALLDSDNRIRVAHLKAALALWEYCDASAKFIFGDATGDPVADTIMRQLRENPNGLSRTAISNALGRHYQATRIDAALAMLAEAGRIVKRIIPTAGRPSEVWTAK